MRSVSGLDKPLAQRLLLAGCLALTAVLAWQTTSMQRVNRQIDDLLAAGRAATDDRHSLEAQLARERATREALSLEIGRLRVRLPEDETSPGEAATLTLPPPASRGATPPAPTVDAPDPAQLIELRLLMPDSVGDEHKIVTIAARDWSTGQVRWLRADVPLARVDGRKAVVLHVTGEMFTPGAYELLVTPASKATEAFPEPVVSFEVAVGQRGSR
jgi:hypothetical protein